jgi:hypothetical protein
MSKKAQGLGLVATLASVLVFFTASPAQASCPAAGCTVDTGSITRNYTIGGATLQVTVWQRIDYINHRVRPYARVNRTDGGTFTMAYDPSTNVIQLSVSSGTSGYTAPIQEAVSTGPVNTITYTSTTLYSCPTTARNYFAVLNVVATVNGVTSTAGPGNAAGVSSTTCGW